MPKDKFFFVYEMTPVKDNKNQDTSQAAATGTTPEEDSDVGTPNTTAPTTAESSTPRGPITEPDGSTPTGPSTTIDSSIADGPPTSAGPPRATGLPTTTSPSLATGPSTSAGPSRVIGLSTTTSPSPATGPPKSAGPSRVTGLPTTSSPSPAAGPPKSAGPSRVTGLPTTTSASPTTGPPTNIGPSRATVLPTTTSPLPATGPPTSADPSPATGPPTSTGPSRVIGLPTTTSPSPATGPPTTTSSSLATSPSTHSGESTSSRRAAPRNRAMFITQSTPTSGSTATGGPIEPRLSATGISTNARTNTLNYEPLSNVTQYGFEMASSARFVMQGPNPMNYESRSSPTPSVYTLDREVRTYLLKRDSSVYQFYPGAERAVYDYIAERTDMYSTNLIESTAHLIKGSFGAGVLCMHEAYMIGGMWTSLVVTIVIGILSGYCMFMLIRSAQKMYRKLRITKLSYPDLAEAAAAIAPWAWVRKGSKMIRYLVDVVILLQQCGTCCIYQIVIAYTIKQMFEGFGSSDVKSEWLHDIRIYILMSAPLLVPLCLIRSLKFMAPFAMLADIFVAMCVLTTLYYSLLAFNVSINERAAWKDLHGFIRICGVCMYSTSGISIALPVENNMRKPRYFPQVVLYAMTVVIIFTVITGVFGYWAWGEECKSPIMVHLPLNTFTTILQFLLVMMLSTTFAVQFWVPFRLVWHYLMRKFKRKQITWERIFRFLMAMLVMGVSIIFPNMIPVMIFLGQFFLGFICLILPASIEFLVDREEEFIHGTRARFWNNAKNIVLVTLGLLLSGSTIYSVRESQ